MVLKMSCAGERTERARLEKRLAALEAAMDIDGSEWEATVALGSEKAAAVPQPPPLEAVAAAAGDPQVRAEFLDDPFGLLQSLFPPRP